MGLSSKVLLLAASLAVVISSGAHALKLVLERYGDRQAEKKLEALKKDCCEYDEDGLRTLWRTAQRELGIPKVVPVKIVKREVRGVGPETPD